MAERTVFLCSLPPEMKFLKIVRDLVLARRKRRCADGSGAPAVMCVQVQCQEHNQSLKEEVAQLRE